MILQAYLLFTPPHTTVRVAEGEMYRQKDGFRWYCATHPRPNLSPARIHCRRDSTGQHTQHTDLHLGDRYGPATLRSEETLRAQVIVRRRYLKVKMDIFGLAGFQEGKMAQKKQDGAGSGSLEGVTRRIVRR